MGGVCHPKFVKVGVKVDVSNLESGDDSVQGPAVGVGPPVVSCVLSDVTKSGVT